MSSRLRRCKRCGRYSLDAVCPSCGSETVCPVPPKYSPEDRMGVYRRKSVVDSWSQTSHERCSIGMRFSSDICSSNNTQDGSQGVLNAASQTAHEGADEPEEP